VVGANLSTLALVSSLRAPKGGTVTIRIVPLAATPLGMVLGDRPKNVSVALAGLFDWMDRSFPADDEQAFVGSMRDLELLARAQWESPFPDSLDVENVLNIEDLPSDVAEALARPQASLVQCGTCRRLCVADEFIWREKQLCAWDYHDAVFGKRGPWRQGTYETRHFETLPTCAYVVPELLAELGVDIVLTVAESVGAVAHVATNTLLADDSARPHIVAKTDEGLTVVRER
jgi:hypothetical protein